MASHENNENLSPEVLKFNDLMRHGNDFVNIEIFRNALEWYQPALEMHIDDKLVNEKINFCHQQLKYERKVKSILALIAAAVIAVVFLV